MRTVRLPQDCSEDDFRKAARRCLARGLPPEEVIFACGESEELFDEMAADDGEPAGTVAVPRAFAALVPKVVCHRASDRFALLYRLLWRISRGERYLLENPADYDAMRAVRYAKAVDRDVYRMHAYVRFARCEMEGAELFATWHEPQHRILRLATPFFVNRFNNMDWLIATPDGTAAWREKRLTFGPPAARPPKVDDNVLDGLWTAYYRTTFNPARLRVSAMMAQMPKRHWATMPETASIRGLVRDAGKRVTDMNGRSPEPPPAYAERLAKRMAVEEPAGKVEPLDALRREVEACRLCPLHAPATQAVFGEGPRESDLMFVGEQPGDHEDLEGRPFVGPAGQVFDRALADAGIDRSKVYVTNAVKHFKFEMRGKQRVHSKPSGGEVAKCRFWLHREIALVKPKLIVALGATAALGLTGRRLAVTRDRGLVVPFNSISLLVTVHPSYLLRLPDQNAAEAEYGRFVEDLKAAQSWCGA